ncbi:hypothetical protein [Lysobacter sp. Root96]|uniref:hypothetical protein n=1 Tax=Lysobacter sp. Root96 TaxID=1736612 RepID=UPI0006F46B9B|nr:hypothetical protein [Lysobacter sp. Root96]KRD71410.1 hypothetical protein ASE45_06260 [Lysobacter sp. Root96]
MTITLGWWTLPLALCVFGVICLFANAWWDSKHSSGGYGDIFNGCLGMIVCAICWVAAAGICIGRWLS